MTTTTQADSRHGVARGALFCGAVAVAVVAWRFENLDVPPNFGAATSMNREADYLARHGFDYWSLRYAEPTHYEGGARVYMTSYMPSVVALGMRYGETRAARLAWFHGVGMAAGAAFFVLFYYAARATSGPWVSALAGATLLTLPATVVQIDNAGMDLAMTVFLVATVLALQHERWIACCVLVFLAYGAKATGLVYTVGLASVLVLLNLVPPRLGAVRRPVALRVSLVLIALLIAVEYALIQWGGTMAVLYRDLNTEGGRGVIQLLLYSPHTAALVLLPLLAAAGQLLWSLRPKGRPLPLWATRLLLQGARHRVEMFAGISLLGMIVAAQSFELLPRYFISLAAMGMLLLLSLLASVKPVVPVAILACSLVVNLTDFEYRVWRGGLESQLRRGALEASYRDLDVVRADARFVRQIETQYPDSPLVLSGVYELYFTLPNLEYTARPRRAYLATGYRVDGMNSTQMLLDHPPDAVFVGGYIMSFGTPWVPRPTENDEVIHLENELGGTVAYCKRWSSSPPDDKHVLDWYLSWTKGYVAPEARVAALAAAGRKDDAIQEAQRSGAQAVDTLCKASGILVYHQRYDAASELAQAALELRPDEPDALFVLAIVELKQGRQESALSSLQAVVRRHPGHRQAAELLSLQLLQMGRAGEALDVLRAAVAANDALELWERYAAVLQTCREAPNVRRDMVEAELIRAQQRIAQRRGQQSDD